MRNSVISVLAAIAAVGGSALFAAPASASNGPPEVGCITGSSCMIELKGLVSSFSGSVGGSNGVVVTPPPCIGVPAGDAHVGSQAIIALYGTTVPGPPPTTAPPSSPAPPSGTASATATASATPTSTPSPTGPSLTPQQKQILDQAKQLVNSNPMTSGEWYQITGDPYATSAASQVCASLPPYVFSNSGLPEMHGMYIPTRTLAELAYSQLWTPRTLALTLNPTGASDTNLPTFVDVTLKSPGQGLLAITAQGHPYLWATAELNGRAATVYAVASQLNIDPGTSNATIADISQCSVAQPAPQAAGNNGDLVLGSREVANAKSYGANQAIDCGVTYTAPGTFNLTVGVGWTACWAPGPAVPGGPPANCDYNFPGATGLQDSTTGPVPVNVREIQSVNG